MCVRSHLTHSSSIARAVRRVLRVRDSVVKSSVLPYIASEDVEIIPLWDKTRCHSDVTAASLWQGFLLGTLQRCLFRRIADLVKTADLVMQHVNVIGDK